VSNKEDFYSSDALLFLKKFINDPLQVGSILPSSKKLGEEMLRFVENDSNKRYLEVGPGTGVFTEAMIAKNSLSHIDLVELDPDFCNRLKEKFSHERIQIFEGSILDFNSDELYDGIISSLPLNAFKPELVLLVFGKFYKLLKPGGVLSWFEYRGFPELKKLFLPKSQKKSFEKTQEILFAFLKYYEFKKVSILGNIPPAIVHHCRVL
jgi:phospholipid N-methyltransferase